MSNSPVSLKIITHEESVHMDRRTSSSCLISHDNNMKQAGVKSNATFIASISGNASKNNHLDKQCLKVELI